MPVSLRQREHVQGVIAVAVAEFELHRSHGASGDAGVAEVVAGKYGDVLAAVYCVADIAYADWAAEDGFPQHGAAFGVLGAIAAIGVAPEDELAGGGEDGAGGGNRAGGPLGDFAGAHAHFGQAVEFIERRAGFGYTDAAFRCRRAAVSGWRGGGHVQAVLYIGHVQRVGLRAVGAWPVGAGIEVADDAVGAGAVEDQFAIDDGGAGVHVDVAEQECV